jgi:hypothetical protein
MEASRSLGAKEEGLGEGDAQFPAANPCTANYRRRYPSGSGFDPATLTNSYGSRDSRLIGMVPRP